MSSHNALLKHVSIAAKDTTLVATFDIDGNIPGQGAYVVGLVAASPDHSHQRRLGIEFMNGEAVSFYCFSHDGTEENFDLKGWNTRETPSRETFPSRLCLACPRAIS